MSPAEKRDALSIMDDALYSTHGFRPSACDGCADVMKALALLPRLRAVVKAAKECVASNIRPDERQLVPLRDALASLAPGEEDHA